MMSGIQNWFSADSPHARFLCIIFLVAALNVFVRLEFLPLTISTDAHSYLDSARLISGEDTETIHPGRLLKPLAPLGIALLAPFFGGNMTSAFLALNILCYLLLAGAAYALMLLFTTDRFLAMLGTLMFISTYPVLEYGLNLYSEMGAWALYVLAIAGAVKYYRDASWKNFWFTVGAVAVGLLWKEYAVLAGIFFGLLILAEPSRVWKEKWIRIALLGVASAATLGVAATVVYAQFHYTYIDWLHDASSTDAAQSQYHFYFIAKSLLGVFLLGWGLVLSGVWHFRTLPRLDQLTLALLLPPSMMFLLWTFVSSRLYYVIAPLLAILALHGLRSFSVHRFVQVAFVVLALAGNYAWLFAAGNLRVLFQ